MRHSFVDRVNFKIDERLLLLGLPFLLIYKAYWFITGFYICFVLVYFIINQYKFNNFKAEIPHLFVWVLLLIWGGYITIKTPILYTGVTYYIGTILIPFVIFFIIVNLELSEEFLNKFFSLLFISGAVLGLYSFYIFSSSGFNFVLRIPSLWDDFNIMSTFLMIISMFNLSMIINRPKDNKLIFYILTFVFTYFGILLSQTRGVWLAIIVSICIYIIKKPKIIFPALILFVIVGIFFSNILVDRFLSVKNFGYDASSLGRLQAWYSSFILILQNPFTGYGFDSYIQLRDSVFSFYIVQVLHSHNTYLRTILEMGLIGFILYFSFYARAFIYTFTIRSSSIIYKQYKVFIDGLQLSFIGLTITFMFEPYFSLYGGSTFVVWLLVSLSFKINDMFRNTINKV